jgi:arylsulfatase
MVRTLAVAVIAALAPCAVAVASASAAPRPSVVVILADDLGFSDIAPYGGEIRTPNLERLAANGLRFRQFYNNAVCSPTRASLLTGLYPHAAGMGVLSENRPGEPGPYQGYLPEDAVTLAEALRAGGYGTYMSGKWHVGDEAVRWPRRRGFDRYFGLISGATSYYELLQEPGRVRKMVLEDAPWQPSGDAFYATDAYSDYAVERIRQHRREQPGRPFFLYLAYTAPHFPIHAPAQDVARYEHSYDGGWDAVREARLARMRQLGITDERHVAAARPPTVPAWADAVDRPDWSRRMAVFAAMVDRMDRGIGRVLDALDETQAAEDTLVLFLSDNGGDANDVASRGLHTPGAAIGARGSYASYREPWAFVSNAPFRLHKTWAHEGGIRSPFIARWPAGLRRPGRFSDAVGHVADLMPTILELAGVRRPEQGGRAVAGRSLAAVLRDEPTTPREQPLYWAFNGNWAVRQGDWKLVYDDHRSKRVELFDLAADPTEQRDLTGSEPARAAALHGVWRAWAERVGARERLATHTLPVVR